MITIYYVKNEKNEVLYATSDQKELNLKVKEELQIDDISKYGNIDLLNQKINAHGFTADSRQVELG